MVAFKMCWWAVVAAYYSSIVRTTHVKSSDKWLSEWSQANFLTKSVVGNTTQGTTNLSAFFEINGTEARRSAKDPDPESGDSKNTDEKSDADHGGGGAGDGGGDSVGITDETSEGAKTRAQIDHLQKELEVVTRKLTELKDHHDQEEAKLDQAKKKAEQEALQAQESQLEEEKKIADDLSSVSKESEEMQSLDQRMKNLTETLEGITGKMKKLQEKQIQAGAKASQAAEEKSEKVCSKWQESQHFWQKLVHKMQPDRELKVHNCTTHKGEKI